MTSPHGSPLNISGFMIPFEERVRGTYILGLNGTGKTTLILEMITQDMQNNQGLCVLDPHGDLTSSILDRVPTHREEDVIVLDMLHEDRTWGLNLFSCEDPTSQRAVARTVDQVLQAFSKLFGDLDRTIGVADLLLSLTHTLVSTPGTTMTDIPRVLVDDAYRAKLVANVKNQVVRDFWAYEYDTLTDSAKRTLRQSTLRRIRQFLSQPTVANIVKQKTNSVNFREAMDSGKILLVQFDPQMRQETAFLGTVVVLRLLAAALSRSDTHDQAARRPFFLYADEFQRFATDSFGDMIQEARKYNLGVIMAHQMRSQLQELGRAIAAAPLGAPNLILFQVQEKDAAELAGRFEYQELYDEYEEEEEEEKQKEAKIVGYKPVMVPIENPLRYLRQGKTAYNPTVRWLVDHVEDTMRELKQFEEDYGRQLNFNLRKTFVEDYWRMLELNLQLAVWAGRKNKPYTLSGAYPARDKEIEDKFREVGLVDSFDTVTQAMEWLVRDLIANMPMIESLGQPPEPIYEEQDDEDDEDEDDEDDEPTPEQYRRQLIRQIANYPRYQFIIKTGEYQDTLLPTFNQQPADLDKRSRLRHRSYDLYYFPVTDEPSAPAVEEPEEPRDDDPPQRGGWL